MRTKFKLGLKGKLSLLLALLLVFIVTCLSLLVLNGIKDDQKTRLEQSFSRQAAAANLKVREEYLSQDKATPAQFMERSGQRLAVDLGGQSGLAVTIYDVNDQFVGTSLPFQPEANIADALQATAQGHAAYITEGDQLLYLAPLYYAEERLGTVQFHASLAEQNAFYNRIYDLFILAGAGVFVIGFLIGYIYLWRQINVIKQLNQDAAQIGKGNYLAFPSIQRQDELGELAQGIFNMSDSIASYVGELHEERQKLMEAIGQLTELEQQQKQFIGNISHELKTPLTSIMAYADLLTMYRDDPALLEDASGRIHVEAQRLFALVEKALQLSAMDIYELETKVEVISIVPLLEETVARLQGKADQRNISITSSFMAGEVYADADNVRHIMLNLLDNAIKYNQEGGRVALRNYRAEHTDGTAYMAVEVEDTGLGIPAEAVKQIFDPFFTVSKDRSRVTGGTGLGLAIASNLAQKQGGNVILVHTSPEGSLFRLELPLYTSGPS